MVWRLLYRNNDFQPLKKKHVQVACPKMIDCYNKSMGGVDLLDRFLSKYRPTMRGKKWWYVFYTHVLNICCIAAWRIHVEVGGKMDSLNFTRYIARSLLQASFSRSTLLPRSVVDDVRYDRHGHNMVKAGSEGRCRLEGCAKNTTYKCDKCNKRLHQKCFVSYHTHD